MSRFFLVLGLALVLVAVLAGTVAALAYGTDAPREGTIEVEGVDQPVALVWDASGAVTIEASALPDLALGLGYAHAADHAWAMTLWRQAGRGALSEWLGTDARGLDRHARTLGFDALARRTYRALDLDTRALLDAYARGVNTALREPGVAQGDAFVLLNVEPDVWRPWDALTVERLIAYLSTPALGADSTWVQAVRSDTSLVPFLQADSTFRATLGIGGTDGARAFVTSTTDGRAFVAHQPAGASALDLFAPATFRLNGQTVAAATIPGTLSLPVGWTGDSGWAVFLTSALRLEAFAGPLPPYVHSRIVERDGDEVLLSVPRDTSGLVLSAPDTPVPVDLSGTMLAEADTLTVPTGWRLRWSGFRPGTDAPAFAALLTGATMPRFALLRGDGLRVQSGEVAALGSPPVSASSPDGLIVGAAVSARRAAAVLTWIASRRDTLAAPLTARALASSDASLWAAQTLRPLLRALGDRDSLATVLEVPYAFLKGWDHRYAPDAIAPSIFETWLASHRDYTGHDPDPTDSLDVRLLPYTLRIARASLRDTYGPDVIGWRWAHLQGGFAQPVAGDRRGAAFGRRFPAPSEGAGGHPTTLFPGPDADIRPAGAGPATWSAWATLGAPRLTLRTPIARIDTPPADADRFGPATFALGDRTTADRPRLTLVSPS